MTVLGSASLVTGNFGLGIAIFVGKLFNKAFKETNMGSNMTQRHYKDLYAKLADIISDLEEKMEEARNDKKLKKARDIKKSLDHFKRLQEQIEKKAGKEFTKGIHRSQGFADQGTF